MTVKTLLETAMIESSTIYDLVIYDKFGYKINLHPSSLEEIIHREELNNTIDWFSVNGSKIVIYCL